MDSTTSAHKMTVDAASGNLFWSVSRNCETARTTRMRPQSVAPSTLSSPTLVSPLRPDREKRLRPVRRSPALQAHFFHMQRTLDTCHPSEIRFQAMKLVRRIDATSLDEALDVVREVAIKVFGGGWSTLEYSRSFALMAHEIVTELRFTSWGMMNAFQAILLELVEMAFETCASTVRLDLPPSTPSLIAQQSDSENQEPWNSPINNNPTADLLILTAFVGDLYAMEIIPASFAHRIGENFCTHFSYLRCRSLYMLLLHAKPHIGPPLGVSYLLKCRSDLIGLAMSQNLQQNYVAQRWIIVRRNTAFHRPEFETLMQEICDIIDQTIAQDKKEPDATSVDYNPVVMQRWNKILSKGNKFVTLTEDCYMEECEFGCTCDNAK